MLVEGWLMECRGKRERGGRGGEVVVIFLGKSTEPECPHAKEELGYEVVVMVEELGRLVEEQLISEVSL